MGFVLRLPFFFLSWHKKKKQKESQGCGNCPRKATKHSSRSPKLANAVILILSWFKTAELKHWFTSLHLFCFTCGCFQGRFWDPTSMTFDLWFSSETKGWWLWVSSLILDLIIYCCSTCILVARCGSSSQANRGYRIFCNRFFLERDCREDFLIFGDDTRFFQKWKVLFVLQYHRSKFLWQVLEE